MLSGRRLPLDQQADFLATLTKAARRKAARDDPVSPFNDGNCKSWLHKASMCAYRISSPQEPLERKKVQEIDAHPEFVSLRLIEILLTRTRFSAFMTNSH